MKKWTAWIVAAALCLSMMGCAGETPAPASESGTADTRAETAESEAGTDAAAEAYQAVVEELTQKSGETMCYAQIACGTGEKLLVVTQESSLYADGQTMEADIYQYAGGAVHFLTSVSSTGSAYPLSYTADAVLFGGNHQSGKLTVSEGTGELSLLKDMNIEGKNAVLEKYSVEDGEQTLVSSEEVPAEDADAYDYYTNAFAAEEAEIILFS